MIAQLVTHYTISQKVVDSIPDEATGFFNCIKPSSRNKAPGSTQPLTETSTRNVPGGERWTVHVADSITASCELNVYTNLGALKPHNPMGLNGLLRG
jgi:hypothetical protein